MTRIFLRSENEEICFNSLSATFLELKREVIRVIKGDNRLEGFAVLYNGKKIREDIPVVYVCGKGDIKVVVHYNKMLMEVTSVHLENLKREIKKNKEIVEGRWSVEDLTDDSDILDYNEQSNAMDMNISSGELFMRRNMKDFSDLTSPEELSSDSVSHKIDSDSFDSFLDGHRPLFEEQVKDTPTIDFVDEILQSPNNREPPVTMNQIITSTIGAFNEEKNEIQDRKIIVKNKQGKKFNALSSQIYHHNGKTYIIVSRRRKLNLRQRIEEMFGNVNLTPVFLKMVFLFFIVLLKNTTILNLTLFMSSLSAIGELKISLKIKGNGFEKIIKLILGYFLTFFVSDPYSVIA